MSRLYWVLFMVVAAGCAQGASSSHTGHTGLFDGLARPEFPREMVRRASGDFMGLWYDGNAELSGYRLTTPRYGELRSGELSLVYVTEPMHRATWIKDDDAGPGDRVDVLKLNQSFGFLTGVYPYSVMTSVFAPIDNWGGEQFTPVKVNITVQEWCGQVFQALWPGRDRFVSVLASYFASEGEGASEAPVPEGTLYEDALLIQLRELDGPFAGGGDWSGPIVPSLWRLRRAHVPAQASPATITRAASADDAAMIFTLTHGEYRRTFLIERAPPRRVLGWTTSEGEEATLIATTRRPYWTLNRVGDEAVRSELGLPTGERASPDTPPGTTRVGR